MIHRFDPLEAAERLNTETNNLLRDLGGLAADQGVALYIIGGIVRDLILGRASIDLDFVVDGPPESGLVGLTFADAVQHRFGGDLTRHPRFGTAKWIPDQGDPLDIDFVTARSERYPQPAVLPEVTPGSLRDDLARRDFTINTLAIRLDGPHFGELVDRFNGLEDMVHGRIRILHGKSFVDDPTRLFRALRYAKRLGFRFEEQTDRQFRADLKWVERLSGERIMHELDRCLEEENVPLQLAGLGRSGLLDSIVSGWHWDPDVVLWWDRYDGPDPAFARWILWLAAQPSHRDAILNRLVFPNQFTDVSDALDRGLAVLQSSDWPSLAHSAKYWAMTPFVQPQSLEIVSYLAAAVIGEGPAATWLAEYQSIWRTFRPQITGDTLIRQLKLKPGPQFKVVLDRVLTAYLDGELTVGATLDDELDWVKRYLATI